MPDDSDQHADSKLMWQPRSLLVMCAVCLALGFLAGYLLRGSAAVYQPVSAATALATGSNSAMTSARPTRNRAAAAKRHAQPG